MNQTVDLRIKAHKKEEMIVPVAWDTDQFSGTDQIKWCPTEFEKNALRKAIATLKQNSMFAKINIKSNFEMLCSDGGEPNKCDVFHIIVYAGCLQLEATGKYDSGLIYQSDTIAFEL